MTVICRCGGGRAQDGCPKHDPRPVVIARGTLVGQSPPPAAAPWVRRESTESSVFDYCIHCNEGVRTAWPATFAQLEANRQEFIDYHVCAGAATP